MSMRKALQRTGVPTRTPQPQPRSPRPRTPQPVVVDTELNLAEKAYQAILQGLFDRTIPAGSEYSQAELSRLLGLTAQPLRDALRTLENEGLVTMQSRSGVRFIRADLELSRSTYQFRSLLEKPGARALAEKGDATQIQDLIDRHVELLGQLEQGGLGPEEKSTLDVLENQLHGALTYYLRNPLIETTAKRLKNYLALVRLDWLTTTPLAIRTVREHIDILEACARRDADAAEAALAVHFQQALQRLLGI
jgi:DNA-binding GntR family transcriptional regulator